MRPTSRSSLGRRGRSWSTARGRWDRPICIYIPVSTPKPRPSLYASASERTRNALRLASEYRSLAVTSLARRELSATAKEFDRSAVQDIREHRIRVWDREREAQVHAHKTLHHHAGHKRLTFFAKGAHGQVAVPVAVDQIQALPRPLDLFPEAEGTTALVARITPPAAVGSDAAAAEPGTPPATFLWDLTRPLAPALHEHTVELLGFDTLDGLRVAWHSAAHLLGNALELQYGNATRLCDGPALFPPSKSTLFFPGADGFFYDVTFERGPEGISSGPGSGIGSGPGSASVSSGAPLVTEADLGRLKKTTQKLAGRNVPFERLELTQDVAREMFGYSALKLDLLRGIDAHTPITAYRCGDFIDLCRGPHVPRTGLLRHTLITKSAALASPQHHYRVRGITFPDKAERQSWEERTQRARECDHRIVGKQQKIFMFHDYSPGSAFMLPAGATLFGRLSAMLRDEYARRGFQEVMSPLMYSHDLWKRSGHLDNYRSNMYEVTSAVQEPGRPGEAQPTPHSHQHDEARAGLKPMNCPGHCLIFAHETRSYAELPLRLADFSALHRNEVSGSLGGLTRLRRFHQDDAHIFCTEDQVQSEIAACLDFIRSVYRDMFGFEFSLFLSTRPTEGSIGSDADWEAAEKALRDALAASGESWSVNEGDGAFYGPKIDVMVTDAIGRTHQCGTVQLDFQLPERFSLEYQTASSTGERRRPIMIHRAVLGSLERFMAILMEHSAGVWPFWLSPYQVAIVPVGQSAYEYAHSVAQRGRNAMAARLAGEHADTLGTHRGLGADWGLSMRVMDGTESFGKRLRKAHAQPTYNVVVVVGDKDAASHCVAVNSKKPGAKPVTMTVDAFLDACIDAVVSRDNRTVPVRLSDAAV